MAVLALSNGVVTCFMAVLFWALAVLVPSNAFAITVALCAMWFVAGCGATLALLGRPRTLTAVVGGILNLIVPLTLFFLNTLARRLGD